jgi:hypothetical protein
VADEKHSWWLGERIYITVTAAMGCFLGVGFSEGADTGSLKESYGEFAEELQEHCPDWEPETVNLDGWDATQAAWRQLFPNILIMRCFLHVVLGIQQHLRSKHVLFEQVTEDLWELFHSLNPAEFGQRLRRLREWVALDEDLPQVVKNKVETMATYAANFKQTFNHPEAYRTSNNVDRLMNYQDRMLYAMQYFHGTKASAQKALRAMALIWNFHPYGKKVRDTEPHSRSPFEALNGFQYHENWLRNLLIASSCNGRHVGEYEPLKPMEN